MKGDNVIYLQWLFAEYSCLPWERTKSCCYNAQKNVTKTTNCSTFSHRKWLYNITVQEEQKWIAWLCEHIKFYSKLQTGALKCTAQILYSNWLVCLNFSVVNSGTLFKCNLRLLICRTGSCEHGKSFQISSYGMNCIDEFVSMKLRRKTLARTLVFLRTKGRQLWRPRVCFSAKEYNYSDQIYIWLNYAEVWSSFCQIIWLELYFAFIKVTCIKYNSITPMDD